MDTKGSESVTLWHSLLDLEKNPYEWHNQISEEGLCPEGGKYLRDNCVYFHKPEESVYSSEIIDEPALKVQVPKEWVFGVELPNCSTEEYGFSQEQWEKSLTPYEEFEPTETAEYVIPETIPPEYIVDFKINGPDVQPPQETEDKGWKALKNQKAEMEVVNCL